MNRRAFLKRATIGAAGMVGLGAAGFAYGVCLDPETPAAIALDIGGEFMRAGAELGISGIGDAYPQDLRLDGRICAPVQNTRSHEA